MYGHAGASPAIVVVDQVVELLGAMGFIAVWFVVMFATQLLPTADARAAIAILARVVQVSNCC